MVWCVLFFSSLSGQVFVCFRTFSRGGNFGLPSTRIVYSSSYGNSLINMCLMIIGHISRTGDASPKSDDFVR